MRTFNGRFRDPESIWRRAPSAEVDAAWDRVSTEGRQLLAVSKDDIIKSNKDPSSCVQIPPSWNEDTGDKPYLAQIEVFHQIHCLDAIRKEVFAEHYYENHKRDEVRTSHIMHCIHMVLQSLMCSADVGIITHNWIHNDLYKEGPKTRVFEDFNVVRKCRDFDTLLEWAQKHALKDTDKKYGHLKWDGRTKIIPGDGYGPDTHTHTPPTTSI
jgi:hypothetical protein